MKEAARILNVLDTGPRKANVLRGLVPSQAVFERVIGHLFLKGLIVAKGKTSGRKIARNGRRMAGFAYMQLALALVALSLITGAVLAIRAYLNDVDAKGYNRGVAETSDAWRRRAAMEQAEFQKEYDELRAERDEALGELQGRLQQALTDFEKEKADHDKQRQENARIERDLRSARLVLRDPGKARGPAAGEACRGEGAASAAPESGGDGKKPAASELSPELAGFLWAEASRADAVIEDLEERLTLAQDTVTAYFMIAKDCHGR